MGRKQTFVARARKDLDEAHAMTARAQARETLKAAERQAAENSSHVVNESQAEVAQAMAEEMPQLMRRGASDAVEVA